MASNTLIVDKFSSELLPSDIHKLDTTKFKPDDVFLAYKSRADGNCFYGSISKLSGGEPRPKNKQCHLLSLEKIRPKTDLKINTRKKIFKKKWL